MSIKKLSIFFQKYYRTASEAHNDAKKGRIIGYIKFSSNFTSSLPFLNDDAANDFTDNGIIQVHLDQTDIQKTIFIQRKIYDAYHEFARNLLSECGKSRKAANLPIQFEAYYGSLDSEIKYTFTPGFILA